jgi:3-oxoacyl-[acyl-carrier-protein] synthase II
MMRMAVKGIGVAGGFGTGVADFAAALERGTVPAGSLRVSTGDGERELPALRAKIDGLDEFIPKRALRRVDNFSKLGLLGASLALRDAGWSADLDRVGMVIASGYGATATTFAFLDSIIADGDICASPTHFANSVHNAAAANISMLLGARGPSLTVSQYELSVPSALITAQCWLAEGRVDAVLVGAIDEVSELVGYLKLRGCSGFGHLEAESAILGEGAAFLLLTRADDAPAYCHIDAVEMGSLCAGAPVLPQDALIICDADDGNEIASRWPSLLPETASTACYTALYGSMPAGAAFDLAAAALVLQRGEVYSAADDAAALPRWAEAAHPTPFTGEYRRVGTPCPRGESGGLDTVSRACAVRLTSTGEFGMVTLSRAGAK